MVIKLPAGDVLEAYSSLLNAARFAGITEAQIKAQIRDLITEGDSGNRCETRSRVVPRSDSACVSTERFLRSGNAGFTKSRRVIGEHVSHPLVGWRSSDQDGWGLRSNLICRGIFEDFHAWEQGKSLLKNSDSP